MVAIPILQSSRWSNKTIKIIIIIIHNNYNYLLRQLHNFKLRILCSSLLQAAILSKWELHLKSLSKCKIKIILFKIAPQAPQSKHLRLVLQQFQIVITATPLTYHKSFLPIIGIQWILTRRQLIHLFLIPQQILVRQKLRIQLQFLLSILQILSKL